VAEHIFDALFQRQRGGRAARAAGKGHETHQVIGREKRPFDERAVVAESLARRMRDGSESGVA
jgi:UDP-N-acetylmuramyl tripeptide synthase